MEDLLPKPSVQHLHDLTVDKVDEVVLDLRLIADGATIHFAVDPYEIAEFCFPVNPNNTRPVDIDVIADDQAAFNEIFYRRQHRPLLLPEYFKELRGILHYFDRELSEAYSKAEILQELVKAGQLGEMLKKKLAYENIVEDHFNVLLAVARGVYSVGVERFRGIYNQRLLKENRLDTEDPEDKEVIDAVLASYFESPLKRKIYTEISQGIKKSKETAVEKERRRRSLLVDAGAIDRTIFLNRELEEAFNQGRLNRRCVILYFSSALRTRRIFDLASVRNALPKINGYPYPVWRTRNQVFAYVVYKSSNPDPVLQLAETIESLEKIKTVLQELQRLRSFQCETCLLKGETPGDCALVEFCKDITNLVGGIKIARNQIENLGLINSLGEDYQHFTELRTNKSANSKFESYLNLFGEVCDSGIKDIALDRMKQKQHWIIINSEASSLFQQAFILGRDRQPTFRTLKDQITGLDQILPSKPHLKKSSRYTKTLDSILTYCRDPSPSQFELLEKAHRQYVSLDPGPGKRDPEQELVNCYLYLAFGGGTDETKAYQYAKKLVENSSTTGAGREMEREYRYVLLWAARRQGEFKEADECAAKALEKWPDDPRFYHGRCLNTYAWLQKRVTECPYTISYAIADAEQAIVLYKKSSRTSKVVMAANYNNLAFFLAMDAMGSKTTKEASEKLEAARNALSSLKKLMPKASWIPEHPEYHHTEAFVEYREFHSLFAAKVDGEKLRFKLRNAQTEIDKALKTYPNERYLELKKLIDNALDRIA